MLSASLVFEVAGARRRVLAGEVITVAPGTAHRFWNDGEVEAHSIQVFPPALKIAEFFEALFGFAQRGELNDRGMPRLIALLALASRFGDEVRPVSPPWPVIRALAAIVGPIAGRRQPLRIEA